MVDFLKLLGIDKAYCISLEKNKANWNNLLKTISDNGFPNSVIFNAVNGSDYKDKNITDIVGIWQRYILKNNLQRTNHEQFSGWGAVGCYLSHANIWKDAKKNGFKRIIIFEDDISFSEDFVDQLLKRIDYIPKYDLLFLDLLDCFGNTKINKYFNRITKNFFGTHSYIITENAINNLLPTILPIEVQIDSYISYAGNLNNLDMYYTTGLCGQNIHLSSIQSICIACDNLKYGKIFLIILFLVILFFLVKFFLRKV